MVTKDKARPFSEVPLSRFGNDLMISGALYSNGNESYVIRFPGELPGEVAELLATENDWHDLIKQTDTMQTEVTARQADGTVLKAIVRKTERQLDVKVQWARFKMDNYACRYCGNDDCPLTVDHLVTWETGGPTTRENLLSACKPCNKLRGNRSYEEWLKSSDYKKVSANLDPSVNQANHDLIPTLDAIPRLNYIKKR